MTHHFLKRGDSSLLSPEFPSKPKIPMPKVYAHVWTERAVCNGLPTVIVWCIQSAETSKCGESVHLRIHNIWYPQCVTVSCEVYCGDGQGGLACCDSRGRKESDTTERLIWSDQSLKLVNGFLKKYHCVQYNYSSWKSYYQLLLHQHNILWVPFTDMNY